MKQANGFSGPRPGREEMRKGNIITDDGEIKKILENTKSIAVIGLSPKPDRDSYRVSDYMQKKGYRIIPIRPKQKEILGETAYSSLDDVEEPVDIVDVFRSSDQIMPHAREALRKKPKVFWMQLGIENEEAAQVLVDAGIDVIMDKCIKIEYQRLLQK
jgi:hypothetical protein